MTLFPKAVIYKGQDLVIGFTHYFSDPSRTAIVSNDWNTGEPVTVFTVNIPQYPLCDNEIIFDINNCGVEGQTALINAGILAPAMRTVRSGYVDYPVHKLLLNEYRKSIKT